MEQQNIKSMYANAQAQRERGTWDHNPVEMHLQNDMEENYLALWWHTGSVIGYFTSTKKTRLMENCGTKTVNKRLKRKKDFGRENSSVQETVMTFYMWGALHVLHFVLDKRKQELLSLAGGYSCASVSWYHHWE